MNMKTYNIELNKQFISPKQFYKTKSDELRQLKNYLDILFENEKIDQ